jgi:hypothetical protein
MLDGIFKKQKAAAELDYALAKFILRQKNSTVLFSRKHGRVRDFTTRDSKLYLTQEDLSRVRIGEKIEFVTGRIDSIAARKAKTFHYVFERKKEDRLYLELKERYASSLTYVKDLFSGYTHGVSLTRAWNLSLVGSLIFGMFLMTMIYRYLGPGALADIEEAKIQTELAQITQKQEEERVLGESIAKAQADKKAEVEAEKKQAQDAILAKQQEFERKIRGLVQGHPIEKMSPYIAKEEPLVAAMFIAIAKKESSWGERVPVNGGEDCYNYVGFRLKTEEMGSDGHSCFSSPKEGFEVTVKRIKALIYKEGMTTAEKMVKPWKCGYDCSWDNPSAVRKWVSDVDYYLDKVLALNEIVRDDS